MTTTMNQSSSQQVIRLSNPLLKRGANQPPTPAFWRMIVIPRPVTITPDNDALADSDVQRRLDIPQLSSDATVPSPHFVLNWSQSVGWHERTPAWLNDGAHVGPAPQPATRQPATRQPATRQPATPQPASLNALRDASESKSTEAKLNSLLAEAAHDIRAPLTSARQILSTLLQRRDAGTISASEDASLLREANQRITLADQWAESVLAENNFRQRMPRIIRRRFYPQQWRQSVETLLNGIAQNYQLNLNWLGWERSLPRLYLDANCLSRIVLNLITNAAQASHTRQEIRIRVDLNRQDYSRFVLVIEDDGIGLDQRVLEQFSDARRHATDTGSGFGLRTARALTESLAGQLSVEANPAGGTGFILSLPIDHVPSLLVDWMVAFGRSTQSRGPWNLKLCEIAVEDMDPLLVDQQLQLAAERGNFVYRLASRRWAWFTLTDSSTPAARVYDTLQSIAVRLERMGRQFHDHASCRFESRVTLHGLTLDAQAASTQSLQKLRSLADKLNQQISRMLDGSVPAIDELCSVKLSGVLHSANPIRVRGDQPRSNHMNRPKSKSLVGFAASAQFEDMNAIEARRQWRVIRQKLESVR